MTFTVGKKVEFVGWSGPRMGDDCPWLPLVTKGQIYTVSRVYLRHWDHHGQARSGISYDSGYFIELAEVVLPPTPGWVPGFGAAYFRPVTDISVFTRILDLVPAWVDAVMARIRKGEPL